MAGFRILAGRVLLALGVLGGLTSVWFTLAFTWDPLFGAVNLPDGPTHSNYHAFRGATLAFAVNMLLIWVGIKGASVKPETWGIVTFMTVLYYLGWWLAWPIWGYRTPSDGAEMTHISGTLGGLVGLALLKPQRPQ